MMDAHELVRAWRREASEDPEGFWSRAAAQLPWFRKWDRVLDWQAPTFRWYAGGMSNLAYNAVDHHVAAGRGSHVALITENERGERKSLTYAELLQETKRVGAALRAMGIKKGDRIAIYMPTSAEAIILMLGAVRIGVVILVVFAGFGAGALGERIRLAGARAVFATDVTYRKGKDVPLLGIVAQAIADTPTVERVVVLRRTASTDRVRDEVSWADFLAAGKGADDSHVALEANEPAYILATSGTTAKPKLAVHTHGGYQVYVYSMAKWMFGLRPEDLWWSTSDIGWVVGHSYIVFAPLLVGCTTIAYEGALDHPDAETFYRIVERHKVTGIFTSPTAVRLLMRYGSAPAKAHDLGSLERVFCAGEVLNAPAWEWFQKEALGDLVPVIDHYWQTETGGPVVGNPYGIALLPIKPGSGGVPLAGVEAAVVDQEGRELPAGEKGIFVIKRPFPGLTARLWAEPERYAKDYWEKVPGKTVYFTGDATSIDEDGYVWFSGRADEIIKIADHRIGTIEVETAFLRNPAVAEAGVTGRPDALRGQVISAFIVLKQGREPSEQLRKELVATVRNELGPLAVIGELNFVDMLPKTRSGKIMRRVLKAVILEKDPGDISTIEDEGSVEEAREAWQQMKTSVAAGD
ncbi:MAG: acetate--CoA ligase [Chloroflexi bacterium]|nr:MAG: acetate--CoA ligase [Chloroflexota bacterium]TMG65987.1 MAG: acetate--CoA ligase [Chloroflexota bacterium]